MKTPVLDCFGGRVVQCSTARSAVNLDLSGASSIIDQHAQQHAALSPFAPGAFRILRSRSFTIARLCNGQPGSWCRRSTATAIGDSGTSEASFTAPQAGTSYHGFGITLGC